MAGWTPRTDDECEEPKLSDGKHEFEVIEAKWTVSKKSGLDMLEINMRVWDSNADGTTHFLRDYLIPAHEHRAVFAKARDFFISIGRKDLYDAGGEFDATAELVGRCGRVRVKMSKGDDGYDPKPEAKGYESSEATPKCMGPIFQSNGASDVPLASPAMDAVFGLQASPSAGLNFSTPVPNDDIPF